MNLKIGSFNAWGLKGDWSKRREILTGSNKKKKGNIFHSRSSLYGG